MNSRTKKSASQIPRKRDTKPLGEAISLTEKIAAIAGQDTFEADLKRLCAKTERKIHKEGFSRDALRELVADCEATSQTPFLLICEKNDQSVARVRELMFWTMWEALEKNLKISHDLANEPSCDEDTRKEAQKWLFTLGVEIRDKESLLGYFRRQLQERVQAKDPAFFKRHPELQDSDPFFLFQFLEYKGQTPLLEVFILNSVKAGRIHAAYAFVKTYLLYSRQETARHKNKDPWSLNRWCRNCGKPLVKTFKKQKYCSSACEKESWTKANRPKPDYWEIKYGKKVSKSVDKWQKILQRVRVAVGPPLLENLRKEEKLRNYIFTAGRKKRHFSE